MRNKSVWFEKLPVFIVMIALSSCAIVTINVNFPAQEVRKAYEDLEEELLLGPQENPEDIQEDMQKENQEQPEQQPQTPPDDSETGDHQTPEMSERSEGGSIMKRREILTLRSILDIDIISSAYAQEGLSATIGNEVRKMPTVLKAYDRRRARLSGINSLLTSGNIGEGNAGELVERLAISAAQRTLLLKENSDRKIIMRGMALAIIKIDKLPVNRENLEEVYPQASVQFAAARRNRAQAGWWIQLPNGKWTQRR